MKGYKTQIESQRPLVSSQSFLRIFFLFPLILATFADVNHAVVAQQASTSCSVCSHGPDQVPFPERILGVEGIPLNTCQDLENTANVLPAASEFCEGIRSVGTLCGCTIPPNSCSLCWDGSRPTNMTLELLDYESNRFIPVAPDGVFLTCESLEAVLHQMDKDDRQCSVVQIDAGERCGCPPHPSTTTPNNSTANNETGSAPPSIPENPPEVPRGPPCTVCKNGDPITLPDKELGLGDLPIANCADLETFAALVSVGTDECNGLQTIGPFCGCPVREGACTFCPHGEPVPRPRQKLNWFAAFIAELPDFFSAFSDALTCELMESAVQAESGPLLSQRDEDFFCMSAQLKSWICGCAPDWRQKILTWGYRLSGIFSAIGSSLIIWHVLGKKQNRNSAYHHLVLGISFFDCLGSVAYILVGVMAPYEAGFYLSRGNELTCKIQGIMIQLGQASIYYNLCLSIYFYMVISVNWKEHQFDKLKWLVHVLVIGVGSLQAGFSFPYIGAQWGVCSILQPPATATYWPTHIFYAIPVSTVLVVLTVITAAICRRVYRQQKKAQRWLVRRNMTLTRKVFWQSFWYVMAFYATFPFLLLSYYMEFQTPDHFVIFIFAAFLTPLQGLMNSLVYFQRSRGMKVLHELVDRCVCCKRVAQDDDSGGKSVEAKPAARLSGRDSAQSGVTDPMGKYSTNDTNGGGVGEAEDSYCEESLEFSNERFDGEDSRTEFAAVAEFWRLNEVDDTEDVQDAPWRRRHSYAPGLAESVSPPNRRYERRSLSYQPASAQTASEPGGPSVNSGTETPVVG